MDVSEALRIAPDGRVVVRLSSPPVWAVLRGDGARAMYLDDQAQHWPAFAVNPFVSSGWARQLSAAMNWPVEVVCVATIDMTLPRRPSASRFLVSTTLG